MVNRSFNPLAIGAAGVLVVLVAAISLWRPWQDTSSVAQTPVDERPTAETRGNDVFADAKSGTCLNWPAGDPHAYAVVHCSDEHRFEVADSVDLSAFPGSEYGPDAPPPSQDRIQKISQELCQAAARQYLGAKYDPNGRFSVIMLWSGDLAWRQDGERHVLCGLHLAAPDGGAMPIIGKVAELDQSKVWPPGTCVTIGSNGDFPIDCAQPHTMEVTGSVDLASQFPLALPSDADQDEFVKTSCLLLTDAYLTPLELRETTLTLIYSTVSQPSWDAGSKRVACSIGAPRGDGEWSFIRNNAKGQLLIDGEPPSGTTDVPATRSESPPIPPPEPTP